MLASNVKTILNFLRSWKNLLALGTLVPLGAWIYSRVGMVNPAILGDEYLYSMNARKAGPWDPPVAGDFSNYLFNFVYQGTSLCGDAFYSCGKIFNIFFFLAFIFCIYIVARRLLPFWGAYLFMIASGLSPLSVYTSMFLPESMYFFFVGLILIAVLRAMRAFTWTNWALVGAAIGIASLVKPHAWLSAIGVGIALLVVGLSRREIGLTKTLVSVIGVGAGAAVARIFIGFLIAGPKALGFFGQYLGAGTINTVLAGTGQSEIVEGGLPLTPVAGVLQLFGPQLSIHVLTIAALMSLAIAGLIAGLWNLIRTKELTEANALALFSVIWLSTMTIEIVMFTGWVTGSGDDHTTRVLLRYYEFLFVIVPLAGLASLKSKYGEQVPALIRWGIAGGIGFLLTNAFTGTFGTLSIQIADAPTLAGLVVDLAVFNAAATLGLAGVVLFAAFPRYSPWAFVFLLPVTMVGTGWQIQDEYATLRGPMSVADIAGKQIVRDFTEIELSRTWVLGPSRFDVTNVAIWADNRFLKFDVYSPGSQVDLSFAPAGTEKVVVVGDVAITGESKLEYSGEGFVILSVD